MALLGSAAMLLWYDIVPEQIVEHDDWHTRQQGLLMHAAVNRKNLQEVQQVKLFNVDLSEAGLRPGEPIFYTSINTNGSGDRIFIGGFKDIQFIVNQRDNPLGSNNLAGGLYELIRN